MKPPSDAANASAHPGQTAADAAGLDPEVADLLFDARTPFVIKFRPDTSSEALQPIDEFASGVHLWPEKGLFVDVLMPFLTKGSYTAALASLGLSAPPEGVDPARPAYMTMGTGEAPDFYRLIAFSAPWFFAQEIPETIYARVLIPSTAPKLLAERLKQLESLAGSERVQYRVTPAERHIILDAIERRGASADITSPDQMPAYAASGPATSRLDRPTPALRQFIQTTDSPAVYVDNQRNYEFMAALEHFNMQRHVDQNVAAVEHARQSDAARGSQARPEIVSQMRSMAMATAANLLLFQSAEQLEYIDHLFVIGPSGAHDRALRRVSTRTATGTAAAEAGRKSYELGAFSPQALPPEDALLDIQFAEDLPAVVAALTVKEENDRPPLPVLDALERRLADLLFSPEIKRNFLVMLASPHAVAELLVAARPQTRALLPLAVQMRFITENDLAETGSLPIRGAMAVLFDESAAAHDQAFQDTIIAALKNYLPLPFKSDFKTRDDGRLELRVAVNMELDAAFAAGETTHLPAGVSARIASEFFDLDTLSALNQRGDFGDIGQGTPLRLDARAQPHVQLTHIYMGDAAARPQKLESADFEPAPAAPACLDDLNKLTQNIFVEVFSSNYDARKLPSDLFEPLDRAAAACAEKSPEKAAAIALLRARARTTAGIYCEDRLRAEEFHAWRCEQDASCETPGDAAQRVKALELDARQFFEAGCDLGDQAGCARLR